MGNLTSTPFRRFNLRTYTFKCTLEGLKSALGQFCVDNDMLSTIRRDGESTILQIFVRKSETLHHKFYLEMQELCTGLYLTPEITTEKSVRYPKVLKEKKGTISFIYSEEFKEQKISPGLLPRCFKGYALQAKGTRGSERTSMISYLPPPFEFCFKIVGLRDRGTAFADFRNYRNLKSFLTRVSKEYGNESYKYGICSIEEESSKEIVESISSMWYVLEKTKAKQSFWGKSNDGEFPTFLIKLVSKTPDEINTLWFTKSAEAMIRC